MLSNTAAASDIRYTSRDFPASAGLKRMIERILLSEGIPSDLGALPWVESDYNVGCFSRMGAAGPWQFVPETARMYGLNVSDEMDERYSWERSTRAAARYLRYLHHRLGSWPRAIAAYNCGEGAVSSAVRRSTQTGAWDAGLPTETRTFLPRVSAAMGAYREVDKGGGELALIMVPPGVDLRIMAYELSIPVDSMMDLNGCFLKALTPSGERAWNVMVPLSKAEEAFSLAWEGNLDTYLVKPGDTWSLLSAGLGVDRQGLIELNGSAELVAGTRIRLPEVERSAYTAAASCRVYEVRTGDTLSEIAQTVGVSSREVATWNGISPDEVIYPGQRLILRTDSAEDVGVVTDQEPEIIRGGRIEHAVREGDTLWDLAMRYGVTVEQIMYLNSKDDYNLSIGEVLLIRPE
jgi:membrane-bound lytic murein transglycosylase D